MFHLLLATDLRRAQTAEECFPRCWITQSFIASPHRRILGKLSWHADYTKSPRAAVSYCLTKQRPRALSAVVSLTWICDEARESTLDTFVTPLLPTYRLMPCMGMGRNAGHVLPLADWGPLLVHTSPSLCLTPTLPEDAVSVEECVALAISSLNWILTPLISPWKCLPSNFCKKQEFLHFTAFIQSETECAVIQKVTWTETLTYKKI